VTEEGKPTASRFGDLGALSWLRSGEGRGSIEIAFASLDEETWILVKVLGDPSGLVLVYSTFEWKCFLAGAKAGEFDQSPTMHDR
jgi:hypothetical protein